MTPSSHETGSPTLRRAVTRTLPRSGKRSRVLLAHGGGGQLTDDLLNSSIIPPLRNVVLSDLLDCGLFECEASRLALTIDSYVVQPL